MSNEERQHYKLATGQALDKPLGGKSPGYKKGGKVSMPYKKGGAAMARKSGRSR